MGAGEVIKGREVPPDRIGCLIDGCGRTFKRDGEHDIVICGKHWRAVPRTVRAEVAIRRRRMKRLDTEQAYRHFRRQWDRARAMAEEAATGALNPIYVDEFLAAM